ncbi:unnamed protein product, partial [Hapterophycus canaliculatus]
SLVKGQPGLPGEQKLPSGQSGDDAMDYLLNGLHATTPGSADSPLSLDDEDFLGPRDPGDQEANGTGQQPNDGEAAGEQPNGGGGAGQQQDGEGAADQRQSGGEPAGQQQGEEAPSSPKEDGGGGYPERPDNWIHQYLLIYCFIGRPSSSQDQDLRTARKTSGPSERPRKRKGGPSTSKKESVAAAQVQGPAGNLDSTAIRMFAGAGEAQSRAQVQKEQAAVIAASAQETSRQAQMAHSGKLVKAVEVLSAVVAARQELDVESAGREREAAARARKDNAIKNLRGEL